MISSTVAGVALVASGLFAVAPAYAAPVVDPLGGQTEISAGRYVVTLNAAAAAVYDGGAKGFAPTKPGADEQLDSTDPAVERYAAHLTSQQEQVAAAVGAKIAYTYRLVLNGFAADLTVDQVAKLRADKRVAQLEKSELLQLDDAVPSTDYLGLSGDGGVWDELGGVAESGKGVVVGILDTGFAPENPSFAGDPLGTTAGAEPYRDGDETVFEKADGGTFRGVCQPGADADQQFDGSECSTKVIGARYFVDGFGADQIAPPSQGEYLSPRDGDAHGSHTGSTAAGNADVDTEVLGIDRGPISGVAPAAKLAVYKVCWTAPHTDPFDTVGDGCDNSDSVAAVEAAVEDGVDVINFSIGSASGATSVVSSSDLAFFNAAAAGVFVAASAGNSGPGATTLDHASPWYTTVAASTIPSYGASVSFPDGDDATDDPAFPGGSINFDEPITAPVVYAGDIGVAGATTPALCLPGSLDPAQVAGNIVICDRGSNARLQKSTVVEAAGGVGVILTNVTSSSIDLDEHPIPTVHVQSDYRAEILALAAEPGAEATLLPEDDTGIVTPVPQLAGFSSRGPVLVDGGDVLKPDISAPGVAILAAAANAEGEDPKWEFLSGTSMASPHVAGLAALYLSAKPNATPAEVKSAMMTTAADLLGPDGGPYTDVFGQGAGEVRPLSMLNPGLVYLNGEADWKSYIVGEGYDWIEGPGEPEVEAIDPSDLNLASIAIGSLVGTQTVTRTVTALEAGRYSATVTGMEGIDVSVEPSTIDVAAGDTATFTVTFTAAGADYDAFTQGYLTWKSSSTEVRSPLAVKPVQISAPETASGTGTEGSVDIEVVPGSTGELALSASGLAKAELLADPNDPASEHSGSGTPPDDVFYPLTVPEDTQFLRVDLDAVDDSDDLDLFVYQLDENGDPAFGWQSASGDADERVNLLAPDAGEYLIQVNVFAALEPAVWDLTTAVVTDEGAPLTLTPPVLTTEQSVPISYTASWTGLDPQSEYFGLVGYGDTGLSTLIGIETGDAPAPDAPVNTVLPAITGTPVAGKKLTATPGEWDTDGLTFGYQWLADGAPIAGATKASYTVRSADAGTELSVVVTATAEGLEPGTATSEPVTVLLSSKTALSLSRSVGFSSQTTAAKVTVTTADGAATGSVQLYVDNKKVGTPVALSSTGKATLTVPKLRSGVHLVKVRYEGSDSAAASISPSKPLIILW